MFNVDLIAHKHYLHRLGRVFLYLVDPAVDRIKASLLINSIDHYYTVGTC